MRRSTPVAAIAYTLGHEEGCGLFDWDDATLDHSAQHGVDADEAEQAILDPRRVPRQAYTVGGERRSAVVGATEDGRRLFVVFTRRGDTIRVISARDATDREKRVCRTRGT